jgi:hypothetical protein
MQMALPVLTAFGVLRVQAAHMRRVLAILAQMVLVRMIPVGRMVLQGRMAAMPVITLVTVVMPPRAAMLGR